MVVLGAVKQDYNYGDGLGGRESSYYSEYADADDNTIQKYLYQCIRQR